MNYAKAGWYGGWVGAAAGVAGSFAFSGRNDDAEFGEKVSRGVVAGGALGMAAGLGAKGVTWGRVWGAGKGTSKAAWGMSSSYGKSMWSHFRQLRAAKVGMATSAFSAFGRFPVLMGAGAALGAAIDTDDRKRGALIGAGVGVGAKIAFNAYHIHKNFKPFQRTALAIGLSAMAFAAGSSLGADRPMAEAEYDPAEGYTEEAPGYGAGLKKRLAAMNAGGDVVLGAHRRRRG